jgi:hypothetical protein
MEFVALRDIEPGEEIAYSYAPLGKSRAERQQILGEWGFSCSCSLCSASARKISKSDGARTRIQEIYGKLQAGKATSKRRLDSLVSEILDLIREEGLEPQRVVVYEIISRAFIQVNDFESAQRYADMAEKTWTQYGGRDHDGVEDMQKLRQELEYRAAQKKAE